MKKIPALVLCAISCIVFGCLGIQNDFDLGDTVRISIGETLYENADLWVKLDSIHAAATGNYSNTIPECRFTLHTSQGDTSFTAIPDSLACFSFSELSENLLYFSLDSMITLNSEDQTNTAYDCAFFTLDEYASVDRKPNIYIYPVKTTCMNVSLQFPKGGTVIESIPPYGNGWKDLIVDPNGNIEGIYSYLYYEAAVDDHWQYDQGWLIAQKDLKVFFRCCMLDYGFSAHEIHDFIVYWIPRLSEHAYYEIYPQTRDIMDEIMPLTLSVEPDHILRVSFVLKGRHNKLKIMRRPVVNPFEREGFVVTEWGVVLK